MSPYKFTPGVDARLFEKKLNNPITFYDFTDICKEWIRLSSDDAIFKLSVLKSKADSRIVRKCLQE